MFGKEAKEMADAPKNKYGSTFDILKQSVKEKFSDIEIHEDPAVRIPVPI